jgi:tripartite-type tricarboxylate transporter receptor subunit TctC
MAPLMTSGEVIFAYSGGTHTAFTDSGQMRVLASLAKERLLGYPDVPTLRELGYDLALHAVRIVSVPADTPAEQVRVLADALAAAVSDLRFIEVTEVRNRQPIQFMSGSQVKDMLSWQVEEYRKLIDEIGLQ